ncbi:MAG: amidohydrolase family protein [Acidobacteria bacterium]|nr:amidohydrolase family protein [Acidobacteriota bacterium]
MLIKGATLVTLGPPRLTRADLRVEGDTIVGRAAQLRPRAGEVVEDVRGRLVLPGFVCAHTHMYSALARGMAGPSRAPRSFPEMLSRVWWTLDQALDDEAIYYSAMVGAVEAVRAGTTTIVDHHASPNVIPGSLDIIREAFGIVGVRGVLCYEVTNRGGLRRRDAGLAENDRFLSASSTDPHVRGLVGAHASFTLDDGSLAALGDLARYHRTGIHIHVAEAVHDVERTRRAHGCGILDRLETFGLLNDRAVLAHGVYLTDAELVRVGKAGARLVHNPRSNMNNAVGHAPADRFGQRAALGTDGWPADMLAEARFAHFRLRERLGLGRSFPVTSLLDGGQPLVSEIFGVPFGTLAAGSAADLVVVDYVSPTPLAAANLPAHLLAGVQPGMISAVMAAGRWVCRNGVPTHIDVDAVYCRARQVAAALWRRMRG